VFTRDTSRRGTTRLDDNGLSATAVAAAARELKVPKMLVPAPAGSRALLAHILSRLLVTGSKRGVSTKQRTRTAASLIVDIYERSDDRPGAAMDLSGVLEWSSEEPNRIVGDHWLVQEIRNEFIARLGRVCPIDWTIHLRRLLLESLHALPARHEGRVYWVPAVHVDTVRKMSTLTEQLEVFTIIIVPVPAGMQGFVHDVITDYLSSTLLDCTDAVSSWVGNEDRRKYKHTHGALKDLHGVAKWYEENSGGALDGSDVAAALCNSIAELATTVDETYVQAAAKAKRLLADTKAEKKRQRVKDKLALPKAVAPPPSDAEALSPPEAVAPPPPVELAPLPDPYITIGDLTLKRNKTLDAKGMIVFSAEKGTICEQAFSEMKADLDAWVMAADSYVLVTAQGGVPRLYLTAISLDVAMALHDHYGITLHL